MNQELIEGFVNESFDEAMPRFLELLRIPSQSKSFDPEYLTNGYLNKTAELFRDYISSLQIEGAQIQLVQDEGYSPFLFVDIEAQDKQNGTILFYGHMDKQPPFEGWNEGLSAYDPKLIGDRLYARGAGDDQYAMIASALVVKGCQKLGYKLPRIVFVFEADEESGSGHVEYYLEQFKQKIGEVDLIICLDSGCGNYDQFWMTSSLRGLVSTNITVKVLNEGVHSGDASGIVPSSFRILRELLSRIDDPITGEVVDDFQVVIPGQEYLQAQKTAAILGNDIWSKFPFHNQTQPTQQDNFKAYLNKVWKAQLSIIGAEGLPLAATAGNVLRPETTLGLSIRLPPTKNAEQAAKSLQQLLTIDIPYNATVKLTQSSFDQGFSAQGNSEELDNIINQASLKFFKKEALWMGEGGSIPLMNTFQNMYPKAEFIITGVLGPNANAHGPNEFLHIPFTKKLICCLIDICANIKLRK